VIAIFNIKQVFILVSNSAEEHNITCPVWDNINAILVSVAGGSCSGVVGATGSGPCSTRP
jgi:hypothetical protein